eukprot:1374548-Prorocentrum_lima.AAC.1
MTEPAYGVVEAEETITSSSLSDEQHVEDEQQQQQPWDSTQHNVTDEAEQQAELGSAYQPDDSTHDHHLSLIHI